MLYRAYLGGNSPELINKSIGDNSPESSNKSIGDNIAKSRLMFLSIDQHKATHFQFKDKMIKYWRNSGCLAKDPEGYLEVQMMMGPGTQKNCLQDLSATPLGGMEVPTMLVEMEDKHTLFCPILADREAIEERIKETKIFRNQRGYYVKVVDNPRGDLSCSDTEFDRFALVLRNAPGEGKPRKSRRDKSMATGSHSNRVRRRTQTDLQGVPIDLNQDAKSG